MSHLKGCNTVLSATSRRQISIILRLFFKAILFMFTFIYIQTYKNNK